MPKLQAASSSHTFDFALIGRTALLFKAKHAIRMVDSRAMRTSSSLISKHAPSTATADNLQRCGT